MASRTSNGRGAWYQGVPQEPGMGQQHTRQQNEQRHQQRPPQQQQQYQQQQQQQQQSHAQFLRDQQNQLDRQTMQIAKMTVTLVTQCVQNTINDDNFMRGLGARIVGPKGVRGLLDKHGPTEHATPGLDRLEKQLKAGIEMMERQSGQTESVLKAMEELRLQVALLGQKTGSWETVLSGLAASFAANHKDGKRGETKTQASDTTQRRSGRIAKQRTQGGKRVR